MTASNTFKLHPFPYVKYIVIILSLCIALGLVVWSLANYQPAPNFYGPRAIYSLVLLSVFLALLGRVLLLHMLKLELPETEVMDHRLPAAWHTMFLFDINAPLYLAAGVLIGVPAAVLTTLFTQAILQGFTLLRKLVSLAEACYRVASTALLVLVADQLFIWIAGPLRNQDLAHYNPIAESHELLGAIVAALVMLLLLMLVSLPILRGADGSGPGSLAGDNSTPVVTRLRAYLQSPVLRFQALVLSVGPLLPVVDTYDDLVAELAWIFFLVPLFAIYYLALVSTRLSIRTGTLQQALQDLRSARRRQDELRDYASLITRVQEEERRRLARELHDDTAQALIALSLGLDGLGRAVGKHGLPEKDVQWLVSLQNLAEHTLEGVRRACRDLRPSVLDDLGLRAALEWLSDTSSSRGVPCTFTCLGPPRSTAPECEIAIFRIVQEALSNIWRHSQATQANVELRYLPGRLELIVRDNGKGFDSTQQIDVMHASQGDLGLVGMRERAILIGATLSIDSSPGKGCTVALSLPLSQ